MVWRGGGAEGTTALPTPNWGQADHVHVAFDHQTHSGRGCSGGPDKAVQLAPFLEEWRLRGVGHLVALPRTRPPKPDHDCRVGPGSGHDAVAEAVGGGFVLQDEVAFEQAGGLCSRRRPQRQIFSLRGVAQAVAGGDFAGEAALLR